MTDTAIGRWDELAARMEAVERRVGAIEWALGWRPAPGPSPVATTAAVAQPAGPVAIVPSMVPAEPAVARLAGAVPVPPRPAGPRLKVGRGDLESMIGRNWTSWVGAIVLVLGAFFFIEYAWEKGWLHLSPAARVMSAIAGGVGLGLAGAWTNRRGMRVLAGTLTGAGVAIVMAAFFGGHGMFTPPVFSSGVALAGVCAAAAAGIWRGVRINAVSVAIVALLGAYLAPAILSSGRDESLMLMLYLGTLGLVGWALAYLRPRWHVLRWFVWTCTGLWMLAWMIGYPMRGEHRALGLGAITFFLAGFQAEAFFTLHRAFRVRDERDESAVPGFTVGLENTLGTLSLLTTAAAFGGYYAILRHEVGAGGMFHLDAAAAVAVGLAAAHGMLALATPSRQFARASVLAAAALVTIAIPLAFGQVAITLAWLILAVALAALGWRRENRAVRVWCVVLLGLALVRLFTFDLASASLRAARWHVGGQGVSGWLLLAWGMGAFAHVVGWLFRPTETSGKSSLAARRWGAVVPAVGTAVVFVASAMSWSGAALTGLGIAWVAGLVALATWDDDRLGYVGHAAVAWLVVAAKWVGLDGLSPALAEWGRPETRMPVLNGVAVAGVLLMGLGGWLARRVEPAARRILLIILDVLGFAWLNFEVLRWVDYASGHFADFATAKLVALSVLWAVVGLAAVVVGFARELRPLRYAALVLLGITLGKILFVDLAQVRPVYRILSFVAVGALLLCVSFVYHRHESAKQGE